MDTRPPIVSRPLLLRFVSVIASSWGFYLPLSVIPMMADASGSHASAGLANGALLITTVAGELATPRLLARVGYRWALGAGLALLGAPSLLLLVSSSFPVILAVNATRGLGFAVAVTAGGALTAALIPDERRGEGLALVGLVGGVPALLALPFGAWAAGHWGFAPVLLLTALAPLAAIATVPALPGREASAGGGAGILEGLRSDALMRPAVLFALTASAAGVVVTYLPLAVAGLAPWVAPVALLLHPTAATAGRWAAGRVGDRRGHTRLLGPGVALCVAGMAAMAVTASAAVVVAGAATLGVGFGVLQNATLSLMYARVPASGFGTVSALWNAAYDLGMGAGAIAVGVVAAGLGFTPAFLLAAASMLPALAMARREATTRPHRASAEHLRHAPAVAA
jgi:predicted MFS family arabinose efflux permease